MRAMFTCKNCFKDFTSQGSLARHLQNHDQSVKHVCNICSVVFRRRDLLTRHMKLHEPGHSSNSAAINDNNINSADNSGSDNKESAPSKSNDGVGEAICNDPRGKESDNGEKVISPIGTGNILDTISRKRCHTACNRCRDLKIKCNGQDPCSRCQRARKPCEFDRSMRLSGRISQIHSAAAAGTSAPETTSLAPASSITTDATDMSHMFMPVFSPISFNDVAPDSGTITSSILTNHVADPATDANLGLPSLPWDFFIGQVTPWPWLHENQFLSEDNFGIPASNAGQYLSFPGEHILTDLHLTGFQAASPSNTRGSGREQVSSEDHYQQHIQSMGSCLDMTLNSAAATASIDSPAGSHVAAPLSPSLHVRDKGAHSPCDSTVCKQRAVDALVRLASQAVKVAGDKKPRTYPKPIHVWSQAPQDLVTTFQIEIELGREHIATTTEATLHYFVRLYADHFHQLWPLLPRRSLESGNIHPFLYLVLASIGAMYMDGSGSECGTFLHNALRRRLVLPVELDDLDDNLVWLGQARLLTQVAALYFGQPRAFSYAQHLGTLLTAQARRMCLFSNNNHHQQLFQLKKMKGVATEASRLDLWLSIEERRRLAFGIFRGDTFTSILLNIKPLVALEELELEFPACNSIFNGGVDLDPRLALDMIEHHRSPNQDVLASNVFHVLLESNEILPPLEPVAHEILLFGLQSHVWRFSHDRQLLERLTTGASTRADGRTFESMEDPASDLLGPPAKKRRRDTITSEVDSLYNPSYQMTDLAGERERLLAALAKWERALPLAKTFARNEEDRSYLLSSLILYHLSLMRLYAPVNDIHQVHYRLADKQSVPHDLLSRILAWAKSPGARIALKRVRSVWSLISQETRRVGARPRFNFNAYVGLHHGAAILWAYNGASNLDQVGERLSASSTNGSLYMSQDDDSSPTSMMHVDKVESSTLLQTFEELIRAMSPARWVSFAEVAGALTTLDFPIQTKPVNEGLQSQ